MRWIEQHPQVLVTISRHAVDITGTPVTDQRKQLKFIAEVELFCTSAETATPDPVTALMVLSVYYEPSQKFTCLQGSHSVRRSARKQMRFCNPDNQLIRLTAFLNCQKIIR